MGTRESSEPSTQGAPFEIQKKEETFFDEYTESLTIYEEGSVGTEFVGNGLAESEKTISFSGNNGDGASQSAASRGEDSSDESGDANRDFSATQNQMLDLMHQDGDAENNSTDQYGGTNTDLAFQDFGVNVPETHLDLGMGLNVSSSQAIRTKEDYEQRIEKRKQSNRESAKRSRLRRQECEKLQATAETLQSEISEIPQMLWRLSEKCEELNEENNDIIGELEKTYGPDAVSDLKAAKVESFDGKSNSPEPFDGESNSAEPKIPSRDNSSPDPLMLSLGL